MWSKNSIQAAEETERPDAGDDRVHRDHAVKYGDCGPHTVRSWSSLAGLGEGWSVLVTPTFPTLTNAGQCLATPHSNRPTTSVKSSTPAPGDPHLVGAIQRRAG